MIEIKAWHIRISNADNILQELEEVPGVLANILRICEVYPNDVRLKNLVWDFYGTLFDCLPKLVTILNRTYKEKNGENPPYQGAWITPSE